MTLFAFIITFVGCVGAVITRYLREHPDDFDW